MPITNYSVLKGQPKSGKVVTGASTHYQITVEVSGTAYTVAVNIESVDGSEVLYAIKQEFVAPDAAGLQGLSEGVTGLPSAPGGLALDFVREQIGDEPMITRSQMALLPKASADAVRSHALENAVIALLNEAVTDPTSVVYAFGSAFADGGVVDGIHDIHMNQGNPVNNHGGDNGAWQDGALFLQMQKGLTAVFIAFQTESWTTDASGDPAATVHRHHLLEG